MNNSDRDAASIVEASVSALTSEMFASLPHTLDASSYRADFEAALVDPQAPFNQFDCVFQGEIDHVHNLDLLRTGIDWRGALVKRESVRSHVVSPQCQDELANPTPIENWGPLRRFNLRLQSLARPTRRAAVVVSMRDDGISILEWVAHYRAIGFEGIFIYANDNVDGSDELLYELASLGVITFIQNLTCGRVHPQRKAFGHSLEHLPELRDFEWVFYADSDEFLIPSKQLDFCIINVIEEIETAYPEKKPSAVCFQWKCMSSNYAMKRKKGLLLERFPHVLGGDHLIKSVVRLKDVLHMAHLHFPKAVDGSFFVGSDMRLIHQSLPSDLAGMWEYSNQTFSGGCVNHYWSKSFEEFLVKKRRGDMLNIPKEENDFSRSTALFFEWNRSDLADNLDPPPAELISRVKNEYGLLLALPGIPAIADRLETNFTGLISAIASPWSVEEIYADAAKQYWGRQPAVATT